MKNLDKKKKIAVAIIIFLGLLLFLRGGGDNGNNDQSTSDEVRRFDISSADSDAVSGWAQYALNEFGDMQLKWVFVVTDSSLTNNGTCIDKAGSNYCADDADGQKERIANTYYRYGATVKSTEDNWVVAAGSLTPIFCNLDQVLADLPQFHEKEFADRTDYRCGLGTLANWQPTDSFVVSGATFVEDIDDVLNPQALNIYDTHLKWSYSTEETANGSGFSLGPEFSSNEIQDQPFETSYNLTVTEI